MSKQIGYGATIESDTLTPAVNVLSVGAGGQTANTVDMTDSGSSDQFAEFVAGILDPGDITAELIYDGAIGGTFETLQGIYDSGTKESWTITDTDGGTFACSGIITNLGFQAPYGDKVTTSLTIKLSGKPNHSAVS